MNAEIMHRPDKHPKWLVAYLEIIAYNGEILRHNVYTRIDGCGLCCCA